MFNMYLSGSSFCPVRKDRKRRPCDVLEFCRVCGDAARGGSGGGRAPRATLRIVQLIQSGSPRALLSEIGNPFSWTRFLASRETRPTAGTTRSLAFDCDRLRIRLGVLINSTVCGDSAVIYFFIWFGSNAPGRLILPRLLTLIYEIYR